MIKTVMAVLMVIFCVSTSVVSLAEPGYSAVQKMATIMHRLKHFPSPQGKETLTQIVSDKASNEREKTIATALLNLNHRPTAEDKAKLKKIMEGNTASQDERDLASMVYHFDHRPTKADKTRLKEIMQQ